MDTMKPMKRYMRTAGRNAATRNYALRRDHNGRYRRVLRRTAITRYANRRAAIRDYLFTHYVMTGRAVLAVVLAVVAPIVAVVQSPSWTSDYTPLAMRVGTTCAIVFAGGIALAISLGNTDELANRIVNLIATPILSGFVAAMMVDNPYSEFDNNPPLAWLFFGITAGGALLGGVVGELMPREDFWHRVKNAYRWAW